MAIDPVGWLQRQTRALRAWAADQWGKLKAWLGPDANAVPGRLNWRELLKVLLAAAGAGGLVEALQLIMANVDLIVIHPPSAARLSLALSGLVGIIEWVRRWRHDARPRTGTVGPIAPGAVRSVSLPTHIAPNGPEPRTPP